MKMKIKTQNRAPIKEAARFAEIKAQIKLLEKEAKVLQARIAEAVPKNGEREIAGFVFKRSVFSVSRFDQKRFAEDHPKYVEQYTITSEQERLSFKEAE